MSDLEMSYEGVGDMLRSGFMQAEMGRRGAAVMAAAIASAPVESGRYASSFELDVGVVHRKTSRACATVRNTAPYAIWVEFGSENNPRHRTLGKALDAAAG